MGISGLIAIGLLGGVFAVAQEQPEASGRAGFASDWSHQHVVFSQPDSLGRLREIEADPRYWNQVDRDLAQAYAQPAARRGKPAANKVDWSESISTSQLDFSNVVTYPAKYSFNSANPAPNCANDYVVFAVPEGASTAANLFAFNSLYVNNNGTGTCPGSATPKALFTYNASQNGGKLSSAPVLSLDGGEIAFIEDSASAQFHVLKWKSGNVAATFGAPWNSTALPDCAKNGAVAPCEYSVVYSTHSATLSAPFIDYKNDVAWVTDDAGLVAAIHPVFAGGTPKVAYTETVGNAMLTPPVYDSVSGNVFVADANGVLYYLRSTGSKAGTCASGILPCVGTPSLTVANPGAIQDAPVVDSTSGTVFVFTQNTNGGASGNFASVVQTTTTLGGLTVAHVGPAGTNAVHSGAFNNAYYSNPGTGLLYVCGTDSGNVPQLYALSFSGTQMNTTAASGPLPIAFAAAGCSPLTEAYNLSTRKDYIFLGLNSGCFSPSLTGCIAEFDVTNGFPSGAVAKVPESVGTTGIIIDNVSNGLSGNASQTNIYFGTLGTMPCSEYTGGTTNAGSCLTKLTQTGLQ